MGDDRRFELPEGLSGAEERAIVMALERYFAEESPKPNPWVLQGRVDALGAGRLQVRRYARQPWHQIRAPFARRGVPPLAGRGDVR
ncbi:MAG: hypothetical protein KatS3mg013_0951 [Actinomycetota bacterium]|nr:MAG: hypothetical protein KatS3mg013_0951 [Actinomycetota bacterium]